MTKNKLSIADKLASLGACPEAVDWVRKHDQQSEQEMWDDCIRGDWMLWICGKLSGTPESKRRKQLVKAACACARLALQYVKKGEHRPRICIETAEAWANGEATIEKVRNARAASYAAYAAAASPTQTPAAAASYAASAADASYAASAASYAADAAATHSKILSDCADIVRKYYPKAPHI